MIREDDPRLEALAFRDAERDMEAELELEYEEEEGDDDDEVLPTPDLLSYRQVFHSAFSVLNGQTGMTTTRAFSCYADDRDQAAGIAYRKARELFSAEEGFFPPDIDTDPEPTMIVSGRRLGYAESE